MDDGGKTAYDLVGANADFKRIICVVKYSLLGWRPLLVGSRPSLLDWRPSLLGWRPLLLGCRPEAIAISLEAIPIGNSQCMLFACKKTLQLSQLVQSVGLANRPLWQRVDPRPGGRTGTKTQHQTMKTETGSVSRHRVCLQTRGSPSSVLAPRSDARSP